MYARSRKGGLKMTPDERLIRDEILAISEVDVTKCMHCGKCSASCPAYDVMDIKPHQFPSYMAHGEIRELMNSTTIWECLGCSTCIERCPRNVKPGKPGTDSGYGRPTDAAAAARQRTAQREKVSGGEIRCKESVYLSVTAAQTSPLRLMFPKSPRQPNMSRAWSMPLITHN